MIFPTARTVKTGHFRVVLILGRNLPLVATAAGDLMEGLGEVDAWHGLP